MTDNSACSGAGTLMTATTGDPSVLPDGPPVRSGTVHFYSDGWRLSGALAGRVAMVTGGAAVVHLTRSLAVAYGPEGVRVNAVLPGPTRTGSFASAGTDSDELAARYAAAIPLGAMIEPAHVAAAFAYLASDEASPVTGASLQVDGAFRPGG